MGHLGAFDEGKAFLEKGLHHAAELNDLVALGTNEWCYALYYYFKGDWESAKKHFEKSIKYCKDSNFTIISGLCWSGLGLQCAMLGDPVTGKRHTEKGFELHRDSGMEFYLSWVFLNLGLIHRDLGDLTNARNFSEDALSLSQKNKEKWIEGLSWCLLGTILGKTQPLEINKAEEFILKGIEICRELKARPHCSIGYLDLSQLYLNAGAKEKALENLRKAEGMFQEMGMEGWLVKAKEISERI